MVDAYPANLWCACHLVGVVVLSWSVQTMVSICGNMGVNSTWGHSPNLSVLRMRVAYLGSSHLFQSENSQKTEWVGLKPWWGAQKDERPPDYASNWGPASFRVICRFLMFLDIPCGDCTGNIQKHMKRHRRGTREEKKQGNQNLSPPPTKNHIATCLGWRWLDE